MNYWRRKRGILGGVKIISERCLIDQTKEKMYPLFPKHLFVYNFMEDPFIEDRFRIFKMNVETSSVVPIISWCCKG